MARAIVTVLTLSLLFLACGPLHAPPAAQLGEQCSLDRPCATGLDCVDGACVHPEKEPCTPQDCGEPYGRPAPICSDGSSPGESCERNASGQCVWRFAECPMDCDCVLGGYEPVCGVDGVTYDATCGLDCVPVEIACYTECPCQLECDNAACGPDLPVCSQVIPGTPGGTITSQCEALPDSCVNLPDPDCSCFSLTDSCDCREESDNMFRISCAMP